MHHQPDGTNFRRDVTNGKWQNAPHTSNAPSGTEDDATCQDVAARGTEDTIGCAEATSSGSGGSSTGILAVSAPVPESSCANPKSGRRQSVLRQTVQRISILRRFSQAVIGVATKQADD